MADVNIVDSSTVLHQNHLFKCFISSLSALEIILGISDLNNKVRIQSL